jgi:hypothetical protein
MKKILIIAMIMLVATMQLAGAVVAFEPTLPTTEKGITPAYYSSWYPSNECNELGCSGDSLKIETTLDNQTYEDPDSDFEVTISDVKVIVDNEGTEVWSFDWDSNYNVCAVVVKASTKANVYNYRCDATDDGDLYSVVKKYDEIGEPSTYYGISHVTFCCCEEPDTNIPEFPTIALPIAAIIGLAFIMQRRKE